jgi:very-short-patch-repair endonuclease
VVTRAELLQAGLTRHEINRRLEKGALLREYKGVYRVGHRAPSTEARYLAAVRACGEGALLSGRAAGHLLGLLKGPPPPPEITTRKERRIDGIKTKRSRQIDHADSTSFKAIPVTTVPRTLVDLAGTLNPDDLARACHEAEVRHRTTPAQVEKVLARRPNTSRAANLRAALRGDIPVTLSKLESRFLEILRKEHLELPQTNRPAGGRRVDCWWPHKRLTVELDSYRYHGSRHAWEMDRRREREAHARGDFRRYTYGDVFDDPRAMMSELRELLEES